MLSHMRLFYSFLLLLRPLARSLHPSSSFFPNFACLTAAYSTCFFRLTASPSLSETRRHCFSADTLSLSLQSLWFTPTSNTPTLSCQLLAKFCPYACPHMNCWSTPVPYLTVTISRSQAGTCFGCSVAFIALVMTSALHSSRQLIDVSLEESALWTALSIENIGKDHQAFESLFLSVSLSYLSSLLILIHSCSRPRRNGGGIVNVWANGSRVLILVSPSSI